MSKPTDIRPTGTALYFLPVHTRMPLKFGGETVTYVTCARARVSVADAGRTAEGWGETPSASPGFGPVPSVMRNAMRR